MATRNQEEVGKCDGCGKFWWYADMGHMDPEGQIIMCRNCAPGYVAKSSPSPDGAGR